jgi:hypothetical protein
MTLILGVVGTASALSFDKTYNKNMWFNSGNVEKTWRFNLDKLKKIDPEDTIKEAHISFGFANLHKGEAKIWLDGGRWKKDITALVTDHELIVKVKRRTGKFKVKWIRLSGDYGDNPSHAPVPEPATILLMGVGLLGLVGYSRKRFSKKS